MYKISNGHPICLMKTWTMSPTEFPNLLHPEERRDDSAQILSRATMHGFQACNPSTRENKKDHEFIMVSLNYTTRASPKQEQQQEQECMYPREF